MRPASLIALLALALSCKLPSRVPFHGGDEASRALATRFLGAKTAEVVQSLRPTREDLGAIFTQAEVADRVDAFYGQLWGSRDLAGIPDIPKDTTVTIDTATTAQLGAGRSPFPKELTRIAPLMKEGLTFHTMRFQSGRLDISLDLFVQVNGHWVLLPSLWKALPPG